jgi:flagellar L-ring protein FlgH
MRYLLLGLLMLSACARLDEVGKAPAFTPQEGTYQQAAMYAPPMPEETLLDGPTNAASLWAGGDAALFDDRRAAGRGDILTVVIEINDKAEFSNSSGRSRTGSDQMGVPSLLGIPQRLDAILPDGATSAQAINTSSASTYQGTGNTARNEKLTLRVAATVVEQLPNGVLRIEGSQEVRVNYELRELTISGYVRPLDISRQNEVTYDKIAEARISYGGRGQITDVQQPRYGQQVADVVLPF